MTKYWRNVDGKRFLYIVVFVLLNLIDFVRQTQQQELWGPIVNITGVLLLVIVASAYRLREFMCRFTYIWTGVMFCGILASALWKAQDIFGIYKWTFFTGLINVWLAGLLIFQAVIKIVIRKEIKPKMHPFMVILWGIMTVCMMISPYGAVWPIWFFVIFGLFYVTKFEKKDFARLCEAALDGTIFAFCVLQVYACGYRPYDEIRYKGAFSNCNMTVLHYLITYVAILLKIHFLVQKGRAKKWKVFFFILAAGVVDLIILTLGRTAWVAVAVITVFYAVLVMRRIWEKQWKAIVVRAFALGLCVVILFPVVFSAVRWLPPLRHHPIWYAGEWSEDKVHSFDPPDSDKYTNFDEFMDLLLDRVHIINSVRNVFVLRAYAAEKDYDRIIEWSGPENLTRTLRIRLAIYKAYLEDLNWLGHDEDSGHYYIADLHYYVWHPQNVWIQVAYYYGIPSGVLFLILTIVIFIKQMCAVIKQKKNIYAVIALLFSLIFFIYGLTEVVWIVGQFVLFMFLFVQHPQFSDAENDMLCDKE